MGWQASPLRSSAPGRWLGRMQGLAHPSCCPTAHATAQTAAADNAEEEGGGGCDAVGELG